MSLYGNDNIEFLWDLSLLFVLLSVMCFSLLPLTILPSQVTNLIIMPYCKTPITMKLRCAAASSFIVLRIVQDAEGIKDKL